MPYYAGIDGGQSATNAVIGDDSGRILGRGSAGPADEVDQDSASTRLRDALAAALQAARTQANLPPDVRFAGVVAGISGYEGNVYGQPPELAADALALEHDAPIAHAGALGAGPGVVIIAGTGSVAYAVGESGASAMTGGWGYLFGDEGSAFWLARKALSRAMRDADAGEPNELAQIALQHFDAPSLRALSRAFYSGGISRAHLASFASLIVRAAEELNECAASYVKDGADALVRIAMRAMVRVGLQAPKIALVGGMFESRTMRDQVMQRVHELLPNAQPVAPRYDPAVGALLLAYKAAGIAPDITP